MTIEAELNKINPDVYLELFDFDATELSDSFGNPGIVYYFTNTSTGGGSSPILWKGNNYYPFPFELQGVDYRGDGTAPNRPIITLSNANKFLLAAVLSLGSLVGMTITRWRTFYKYTDNGSEANPLMTLPAEEWTVARRVPNPQSVLQFELSSPLDRPGATLPAKQILRDFGFPGVSRVRSR